MYNFWQENIYNWNMLEDSFCEEFESSKNTLLIIPSGISDCLLKYGIKLKNLNFTNWVYTGVCRILMHGVFTIIK